MIEINKIYNEDCLSGMQKIDDKTIDCVICDMPYGTTKNRWKRTKTIAAIKTNRNFIGFDIEKKYCDIAT